MRTDLGINGRRAIVCASSRGLGRTCAQALAEANVTINNLLPGAFATDRLQSTLAAAAKRKGISVDQARAERIATVPARRIGDPVELGATCAFLCSAHAGYITGQNIVIDGGAFPGAF